MVSSQVHSGFGYQGGQFGDKVHRFEDDVSRAITIRGFQLIANHALFAYISPDQKCLLRQSEWKLPNAGGMEVELDHVLKS